MAADHLDDEVRPPLLRVDALGLIRHGAEFAQPILSGTAERRTAPRSGLEVEELPDLCTGIPAIWCLDPVAGPRRAVRKPARSPALVERVSPVAARLHVLVTELQAAGRADLVRGRSLVDPRWFALIKPARGAQGRCVLIHKHSVSATRSDCRFFCPLAARRGWHGPRRNGYRERVARVRPARLARSPMTSVVRTDVRRAPRR